jgi:hypothetical protein
MRLTLGHCTPGPSRRLIWRALMLTLTGACAVLTVTSTVAPRATAAPAARLAAVAPMTTAVAAMTAHEVPAAAPSRSLSPHPASAAGAGGCGFLDFTCHVTGAITGWFAGLVRSAVNPLLSLIGRTVLSTPRLGAIPAVHAMWAGSLAVADACYVLLVLIGGIVLMSRETLQTSYSVKEIAPRLVIGFLAANLSLLLAGKAIELADGLSAALAGQGLDPAAAARMLRSLIVRVIGSAGAFFVLLAVFAIVLVLVLGVIYFARLMVTVVLLAVAPLALACHALPQAEGIARWWWRAFGGVLAIQAAQAMVLTAALRLFFTEPWAVLVAGATSAPGNVSAFDAVQLLCVLYILIRIPFWIGRRVWSGGRSPLWSAARYVIAAVLLRRITPALAGRRQARRGP